MKEAGLQIWSQAEVRATKGEEWQGWLDALMEELDSIKTAGVHQTISKSQVAKQEKKADVLPSKIVWATKPPPEHVAA